MINLNGRRQEVSPDIYSPIIIIGMHRSGTSMLARILSELDIHMGADCKILCESDSFRFFNNKVLSINNAAWFRPGPMQSVLENAKKCSMMVAVLHNAMGKPDKFGALRLSQYEGSRKIFDNKVKWGWKDPRNTITLPLWRRVFPECRVIHIVRNGVDVANSLMEREKRSIKPYFFPLRCVLHRMLPRLRPDFKSQPFRDHQEAFELWVEYLNLGLEAVSGLSPDHYFEIRYEDIVADPMTRLKDIARFLKVALNETALLSLVTNITTDRRYAFKNSQRLREHYLHCHSHPMMSRFGYDKV